MRRVGFLEPLEDRRLWAIIVINSVSGLGDSFLDDGICDTANDPTTDPPTPPSGICTLRAAAQQSNHSGGDDEIRFTIPGGGVPVIDSNAAFTSGSVEVDGTTQPGGKVEIRGTLSFLGDGGHTVKGLVVSQGGLTFFSSGNTVIGNHVGVTPDGSAAAEGSAGIEFHGDNNRLGGVDPADRNVIVGDVVVDGSNNKVHGNYFGIDATGEVALEGSRVAIQVVSGQDNEIGGTTAAHGNVIGRATGLAAIEVRAPRPSDPRPSQTIIRHNLIGTNKTGTKALVSHGAGIVIGFSTNNAVFNNVISAVRPPGQNGTGHGIILDQGANGNIIQGNKIGTDITGMTVDPDGTPGSGDEFGNADFGVFVVGGGVEADNNVIGGASPEQANVISGNRAGIRIFFAADGNVVEGNYIGTNATGTAALPNGKGIEIQFSNHNLIGGAAPNVISGNTDEGIVLAGNTAMENVVAGNRIGTNLAGDTAIPNRLGILINDAPRNCIGAVLPLNPAEPSPCSVTGPGMTGNLVSGNEEFGVRVVNANATGNRIQANRIGTNLAGGAPLANGLDGVSIEAGADANVVGGDQPVQRNLISGNAGDGVLIIGIPGNKSRNNVVAGNYIGVDVAGELALPNGARGVHVDGNAELNVIGGDTPNTRNIISGNRQDGVIVFSPSATMNQLKNNFIGTNQSGERAIPNERNGVYLMNSGGNHVGEITDTEGRGNLISGNRESGVRIEGISATENVIQANAVGTTFDRTAALRNDGPGIFILNASGNLLGGSTTVAPIAANFLGNVISGNRAAGIKIEGEDAAGNLIGANLIGTAGSGTRSLPNLDHGIHIVGAPFNRIGASLPDDVPLSGNTLSANSMGIRIEGAAATGNMVGGNRIGTDWEGNLSDPPLLLGNALYGVDLLGAPGNFIGGFVGDGQGGGTQLPGNIIAANRIGVRLAGDGTVENRIQRNAIFANTRLAIDLNDDGVSPNDGNQDADLGSNRVQNFPVLTDLTKDSRLKGTFHSAPGTTFTLDVFANAKVPAGLDVEAQVWQKQVVVTTDGNGNVSLDIPVTFDARFPVYTMTATDPSGNTSEVSAPFALADLAIDDFSYSSRSIERFGDTFVLPYVITIRNVGGAKALGVPVSIRGNGDLLSAAPHLLALDPDESFTIENQWDITELLRGDTRGVADLTLSVQVDVQDNFPEPPDEEPNEAETSFSVDGRPRILLLNKEFREGVFLEDVALNNTIDVFVDFNGNLRNSLLSTTEQPRVFVQLNGVERESDGSTSLDPTVPTSFSFQMGTDLDPGPNLIRISAETRLHRFVSPSIDVQYDQILSVPWIEQAIWTVAGIGGEVNKIAEYKAGIFFPQVATQGAFGIPVDRVGLAGGAFGTEFPRALVQAVLRSDMTSQLTGQLKLQAEVGSNAVGGGSAAAVAEITGRFSRVGNELDLDMLTGKLRGEAAVKTPAVPMPPPVSFLRAQGKIGLAIDASLIIEENDETGTLDWPSNLILGLEPSVEGILILGAGPVSLEGGIGGRIRGEFSLAGEPCIPLGGRVDIFARVKAAFLVFEAEKTFTFPFPLPSCGGGSGEGEPVILVGAPMSDNVRLIPRTTTFLASEGEPSTNGLPQIAFPHAKPSLARRDDGTMMLVYVDEDPSKADGQQLEIFATHWDGAVWSEPVAITDDTRIDDVPSVTFDENGNAVAVWSRVKTELSNPSGTDPEDLLGDLEIVYAVWNSTSGSWSAPLALTDDGQLDFLPQVRSDSQGNVLAMWLHDAGNDMPVFPDDDTRTLGSDYYYARWDGAAWTAPAMAVHDVRSNEAPQFYLHGDRAAVVWSHDLDGDVTTDTDREIQLSLFDGRWNAPMLIGGNADGLADLSPRIVSTPDGSRVVATWVSRGIQLDDDEAHLADRVRSVELSDGALQAVRDEFDFDSVSDPQLAVLGDGRLAIVFQSRTDVGPDVYTSVTDAAGHFQPPLPLTETAEAEWGLQPLVNDAGELEVFFLERVVGREPVPEDGGGGEAEAGDPIRVPVFGGSRITSVAGSLAPDLVVDAIIVTPANPPLGSAAEVKVMVRNQGLSTGGPSAVELSDEGAPVGPPMAISALGPGATATVVFGWTVPPTTAAPRTLLARVDAADAVAESDEANNERVAFALQPDLVVSDLVVDRVENRLVVSARVTNVGSSAVPAPFQVALRLDTPEAPASLVTRDIDVLLSAGESTDVELIVDNPLSVLARSRTAFLVADSAKALSESDETNNAAFGLLTPFTSWQNPFNRYDVDNDTHVVPQDVLLLVNRLNLLGSFRLFVPAAPPFFLDVSGDGFLAPIDVLQIVNYLNANPLGEGEGGQGSEAASGREGDSHRVPADCRIRAGEAGSVASKREWHAIAEIHSIFADTKNGGCWLTPVPTRVGTGMPRSFPGTSPDDELVELLSLDVERSLAARAR